MDSLPQPSTPVLLGTLPRWLQWMVLVAGSALLATVLEVGGMPAALLIGPMLVAVVSGVNGATIRPAKPLFIFAQATIGALIVMSISVDIFTSMAKDWPLLAGATIATVAASSFLGWLVSRLRILPGTTAVWGSAPGAATAMVLMADAFGADSRLVAFMQYLRVIMVTMTAAVIAGLWVDTSGVPVADMTWFPPIQPAAFAITIAIIIVGGLAGKFLRLPSPYFLGTMILGTVLHLAFSLPLQLPPWLLGVSYMVVGWTIGLNFTRPILRSAARALPQVFLSIVVLIAFCGAIAWILAHNLGIDPLTAYLATSPGGMDSVAIIAAASNSVDISFILAMQMARFLVVLILGPSLARLVARAVRE